MTDKDELYRTLEQLTEEEVKERLDSGLYEGDERKLVWRYLKQKQIDRALEEQSTHIPNLNMVRLTELQIELVRLQKGQSLRKSHEWLDQISSDRMDRDIAIFGTAAAFGCNASVDETGIVFTRNDGPMPAFEWADPVGSA